MINKKLFQLPFLLLFPTFSFCSNTHFHTYTHGVSNERREAKISNSEFYISILRMAAVAVVATSLSSSSDDDVDDVVVVIAVS